MRKRANGNKQMIARILILTGIFIFCLIAAAPAAAESEAVDGRTYLQSIGADRAQIAHLEGVWRTW